jgi:hypothetical protein
MQDAPRSANSVAESFQSVDGVSAVRGYRMIGRSASAEVRSWRSSRREDACAPAKLDFP